MRPVATPARNGKLPVEGQTEHVRWSGARPSTTVQKQASCSQKVDDLDRLRHVESCPNPNRCAVCSFLRSSGRWGEASAITREGEAIGSWLILGKNKAETIGLGCWVCQQAGKDNEYARASVVTGFLGNVRRHGCCVEHQEALAMLGFDSLLGHAKDTPTEGEFQQVLNRLGQSLRKGVASQFGRHKCAQMEFCLAEASRQTARQFLSRAVSVAVSQDFRKNRLLMRFTAVDSNLEVRRGFLGSVESPGGETITNVLLAMDGIVTRFFTSGAGGPAPQPVDEDMKQSFCEAVTVFVADAASTEQGAGRCSQHLFPNLISVQKDRPHAVQRLLRRPWTAVPEMNDLLQAFVFGSGSICQRIEFSPVLAGVFQAYVKEQEACAVAGRRVRNLQAAKHRFASCHQPLGRLVLYWDSMLSTLDWVMIKRQGTEDAKEAREQPGNIMSRCTCVFFSGSILLNFLISRGFRVWNNSRGFCSASQLPRCCCWPCWPISLTRPKHWCDRWIPRRTI